MVWPYRWRLPIYIINIFHVILLDSKMLKTINKSTNNFHIRLYEEEKNQQSFIDWWIFFSDCILLSALALNDDLDVDVQLPSRMYLYIYIYNLHWYEHFKVTAAGMWTCLPFRCECEVNDRRRIEKQQHTNIQLLYTLHTALYTTVRDDPVLCMYVCFFLTRLACLYRCVCVCLQNWKKETW